MSYQFVNDGNFILVKADTGELMILKTSVLRLSVLRDDIIELYFGNPLRNIYFHYGDVTAPKTGSALELRDAINSIISPPVM